MAELQQAVASRSAEVEATQAAALAAAAAARLAAEEAAAELKVQLASVSESAATAQAALAQEVEQLKARVVAADNQRADIEVRGGPVSKATGHAWCSGCSWACWP